MLLRPATANDLDDVTEVFLRARERMTYLPDLHAPEETRRFLRDTVLGGREVWVVEQEQRVLGFAALNDNQLEHLYVHPLAQRFGIGSALLERVKERRSSGLKAWVFQKNEGARRFYEARGFQLVQLTNGAANEEQEPDALYEWKPAPAG